MYALQTSIQNTRKIYYVKFADDTLIGARMRHTVPAEELDRATKWEETKMRAHDFALHRKGDKDYIYT